MHAIADLLPPQIPSTQSLAPDGSPASPLSLPLSHSPGIYVGVDYVALLRRLRVQWRFLLMGAPSRVSPLLPLDPWRLIPLLLLRPLPA